MASNDWEEVPLDDWQDVDEKTKDSSFSLEGVGRAALKSLPIAGGMFGGAVGLASSGPVGAVAGAGLGAAGGKALEQAGEAYFFGEGPKSRLQQFKEIGMEGLAGAAGEGAGQIVSKAAPMVVSGLKKVGPKIGHALTGVSEQEIKTYAKNADVIKQMAKETDSNSFEAANQIRNQFNKDIANKTTEINNTITNVLKNSNKQIESQPIVDALENYKTRINPKLYPEQVGQIDDLVSRISNVSQNGKISILEAHQIKQFLQDKASSAYRNGDVFQIGAEAANAAKGGAKIARDLVSRAEPEIAKANGILSKFHVSLP